MRSNGYGRSAGGEPETKAQTIKNALTDSGDYHGICQGIVNLRGYALSKIRKFKFAQRHRATTSLQWTSVKLTAAHPPGKLFGAAPDHGDYFHIESIVAHSVDRAGDGDRPHHLHGSIVYRRTDASHLKLQLFVISGIPLRRHLDKVVKQLLRINDGMRGKALQLFRQMEHSLAEAHRCQEYFTWGGAVGREIDPEARYHPHR